MRQKRGFGFVKYVIRSSFCAAGAHGLGENRFEKPERSEKGPRVISP